MLVLLYLVTQPQQLRSGIITTRIINIRLLGLLLSAEPNKRASESIMENKRPVPVLKAQKTWYFEGDDHKPFSTQEKEAFELLTNNSGWRRRDLKLIGCSDGVTYVEYIKKNKAKISTLTEEIKEKRKTLNKYVQGHDKLMFEQFIDEEDPRVKRAKSLIAELEEEIEPLEKELRDKESNIYKEAFNKALEEARGNIVMPGDFSVIGKVEGNVVGADNFLENFKKNKAVI